MTKHAAPQTIYLQVCNDKDCTEEFNSHHDVTWCQDQINKTDIRYVRADINAELLEALKAMIDWEVRNIANWDNPAHKKAQTAIAKAEGSV